MSKDTKAFAEHGGKTYEQNPTAVGKGHPRVRDHAVSKGKATNPKAEGSGRNK